MSTRGSVSSEWCISGGGVSNIEFLDGYGYRILDSYQDFGWLCLLNECG